MITAQDIARQYDSNPSDVFNAMIDALAACGPQYALFAQTLEVIGLALQDLPLIRIDHD